MGKILHIDTDLQQVNRIFKDENNKVKQITDKVNNIAFVQTDVAKQPTYNYDGYYEFGADDEVAMVSDNRTFRFLDGDFTIIFRVNNLHYTEISYIFRKMSYPNDFEFFVGSGYSSTQKLGIQIYKTNIHGSTRHNIFSDIGDCTKSWTCVITGKIDDSNLICRSVSINDNNTVHHKSDIITIPLVDIAGLATAPIEIGKKNRSNFEYLKIYNTAFLNDKVLDISIGDTFNVPQPFRFHKRYRTDSTKKLFLSSKYLKDAEIDSSDEVTKITNYINSQNDFSTLNHGIFLSNKGIIFDDSIQVPHLSTNNTNIINLTDDDFYMGLWVYDNEPVNKYAPYITKDNLNTGNRSFSFIRSNDGHYYFSMSVDGVSIDEQLDFGVAKLSTYEYISVLRKGDILYGFVNGVLNQTHNLPTTYIIKDVSNNIMIGVFSTTLPHNFTGYLDDVLISIGDSIINPTGKSIGYKCFEPPRRRGNNSEIQQY